MGPHRALAFPKQAFWVWGSTQVYNLLPGSQGAHKGTLSVDGYQVTICGGQEAEDLSLHLHHLTSSQETALNIKMICAYPPAGPYVSFPFPPPPPTPTKS